MPQIKGSTKEDEIKMGIDFLTKILSYYQGARGETLN
jgi:hypothetical protein